VFYSKGPPLAGTVVRIPAFKGQAASNVTKALESMLLRVTEKSSASALRKGTFLRTEPIAATDVAACSEVVVVASNGIAPVESTIPNVHSKPVFEPDSAAAATSASKKTQLLRVPDLANMPLKSAELTLRKSGFKSTKPQFKHAANIARDHVIRTEPSAGSELPRGSEVTVYYSLGQTLLRIPFLQGIKIKSALQSLKEMEISPIQPMGEFSDKSPLQEVTRTRPPGGSEYLRGTSVTVYYSLGPEPFWKCLLRWFGELPMWAKAAEAFAAIAAARHGWRRIKGGSSSPAPAMPSVSGSLVHGVCEIHTPNGPTLQISISGGLGTSEVPNLRFTHHGSTS
jgi:beta-lactam-binding protein with PASTA domain